MTPEDSRPAPDEEDLPWDADRSLPFLAAEIVWGAVLAILILYFGGFLRGQENSAQVAKQGQRVKPGLAVCTCSQDGREEDAKKGR